MPSCTHADGILLHDLQVFFTQIVVIAAAFVFPPPPIVHLVQPHGHLRSAFDELARFVDDDHGYLDGHIGPEALPPALSTFEFESDVLPIGGNAIVGTPNAEIARGLKDLGMEIKIE